MDSFLNFAYLVLVLRREHWICYSLETLAFGCQCGGDDPLSKGLLETVQSRGGRHLPLFFLFHYMGVNPKIGGKPPKWMVKIMENPMNKWDDLGVPLFLETPI